MRLASKDVYPHNICKLVFGHVENFDEIYSEIGYPEMIQDELYVHVRFTSVRR